MERYTLAPNTREILVNRPSSNADDLFSYGPETQAQARSLGHLFIVGHTDQENGTVGYLVSLIAALAKREYYALQPAGDSKQAFARTLRKVNEVVEEFLKTNDVNVHVGIFAVAGSTLYVSRLGKFSLLLAREGKVVDVLKDVANFSKEVVQKRRFSSVISGPVQYQDRLLAYFPQRALIAREKAIKATLSSGTAHELSEKLITAGEKKETFSCALLHVDIERIAVEQDALIPVAPGTGGDPAPRLAWSPRQGAPTTSQAPPREIPEDTDTEADTLHDGTPDSQEAPHIIASEFSHRSRTGSVAQTFRNIRLIHWGARSKALVLGLVALIIAGGAYGLKARFFTSETELQWQTALQQASGELRMVQDHLTQGEGAQARATILNQLAALDALDENGRNKNVQSLKDSYREVLDTVDRAEPATLTLIATLPAAEGTALAATMASGSDTLWMLARNTETDVQLLAQFKDNTLTDVTPLERPVDLLRPAPPSVLLAHTTDRTLTPVASPNLTTELPTPDTILDVAWFSDAAYVLTTTGILRASDLDTFKPVSKQWLEDVTELSNNATRIAVDGGIWTWSRNGVLTYYFRGTKEAEYELPFAYSDGQTLVTEFDMPFLYILDRDLKRVYVIDKETLEHTHTIAIEAEQEVTDIFMGPEYSLYMLASDGKIWRLE